MDNFKRILDVLNDLIKINKDREESYAKASRELTPAEHNLRGIFERKAQESRNNVVQLEHKAQEIRGRLDNDAPEDGSDGTNEKEESKNETGSLNIFWESVKDFFTGNEKSSLVKSCLDGDKAIAKCYEDLLQKQEIPDDVSELLLSQKKTLDESRDLMVLLESSEGLK